MTGSARLQREADAARAELGETLGRLREGLAPATLSGEAIALGKECGLFALRSLATQVRTNPMPAVLIGAGLAMLLTRTTGGDVMAAASSTFRSAAAAGTDAARGAASGVASAAAGMGASAASAARAAAESVREATGGAAASVAGTATDAVKATTEGIRRRTGEAYEEVKDAVQERTDAGRRALDEGREAAAGVEDVAMKAREKAGALAGEGRQKLSHLMQEQPLLMAALGVVVGAAVGALLPLSRSEKEMIGAAGARAVGAGRDALSGAAEIVREEVEKADFGGKVDEVADRIVEGMAQELRQKS
ncbi:MAG: hypothetical protein ACOY4R_12070 [Pseudomonadota bacterium]